MLKSIPPLSKKQINTCPSIVGLTKTHSKIKWQISEILLFDDQRNIFVNLQFAFNSLKLVFCLKFSQRKSEYSSKNLRYRKKNDRRNGQLDVLKESSEFTSNKEWVYSSARRCSECPTLGSSILRYKSTSFILGSPLSFSSHAPLTQLSESQEIYHKKPSFTRLFLLSSLSESKSFYIWDK